METLDLRKELKQFYLPPAKKIELIEIPAFNFVMIDGAIEPDASPGTSPQFEQTVAAMYGTAYTLKFMFKKRKEDPIDYPVMALEGLWFVEDGHFDIRYPGNWKYTLMILQPEVVGAEHFAEAVEQLRKKKPSAAVERLRYERFQEGLCVQTMHIGPYADEPATVDRMEAFAAENGYKMHRKHHEIYLGDPRRGNPAKMKTVLRHPVTR
jgi:hypothetical protein